MSTLFAAEEAKRLLDAMIKGDVQLLSTVMVFEPSVAYWPSRAASCAEQRRPAGPGPGGTPTPALGAGGNWTAGRPPWPVRA